MRDGLQVREGYMVTPFKNSLLTVAGVFVLSASGAVLAHTYERCDRDGDHCARLMCDSDGDRCWKQSEYSKEEYYNGTRGGRWICDSDGDRCHYEYTGRKWDPHWDHHDHEDSDR